jgi:alanine-glyoxylate transaminase/serine-glyoxylate transaminase/serine-pyruvate transaminase
MHPEFTKILQGACARPQLRLLLTRQFQLTPLLLTSPPPPPPLCADTGDWLRYAFQTSNNLTVAVSGTGHAGMEAAIANVVEPGDVVLVGVNGLWGERVADLTERYGGIVRTLHAPAGSVFSLLQLEAAFDANPDARVLFLTHGESSTGTLQPLDGVGALCAARGAIFILDTVCSLGGVPLYLDQSGVDVTYSGSQKCLGAPPGSAPFSMSQRARDKLAARKSKVQSYYFDANLFAAGWGVDGKPRWYHATAPINSFYQLRESLAMLAEEGLEAAWARHAAAAQQLYAGLERLGLKLYVKDPVHRLATVTTVEVPEGVLWSDVTAFIMHKYQLEIAGGLGPSVGKVWRIGIMGHVARPGNVALVLAALEDALTHLGLLKPGAMHAHIDL